MSELLSRQEVTERIQKLNELVAREQEIKEKLVNLKLYGNREHVFHARKEHDELIAEIERLRMTEMLPIATELNNFIEAAKKKLGRTE